MSTINKVCVFGVGGVGGYFGGKIANTINQINDSALEIYFIARGQHLEMIRRDGIKIISQDQTIVAKPTLATDNLADIPKPDLFLLCVKAYDLTSAVRAIKPFVIDKTVVLPLLNGADIYERIRADLQTGIVLPACVYVGTHIEKPGIIRQNGGDGNILFGKDPRFVDYYADNITAYFDRIEIPYKFSDDPYPAIWSKFIFIAAFGLVTVYTGMTLGQILENPEALLLVRNIMSEINQIAKQQKIALPSNIIDDSIAKASNFPYETKTSYQRDVEGLKNVDEGDLFGGMIVRQGEALNIPTPTTLKVYSEIQKRTTG